MVNVVGTFFDLLFNAPLYQVALWALLLNILIFIVCLIVGQFLVERYISYGITEPPPPIIPLEIILAISCVLLNALVAFTGVILWREGIIHVDFEGGMLRVVMDIIILFIVMDFAMYVFHRIAHHPLLFPIVHSTHHRFENPRPLTLFVLNPAETLGFGVLWLLVISIYSTNWLAIIIYLIINIIFGLVGHTGVEILPLKYLRIPGIRNISTSTFHAEHHMEQQYNFGFYTLIWDRLFGTISPSYVSDFTAARKIPLSSE